MLGILFALCCDSWRDWRNARVTKQNLVRLEERRQLRDRQRLDAIVGRSQR
jgi:hypothetical protein